VASGAWARQLALLAAYVAAGIAVTWPRAPYLAEGKLPAVRDVSGYVWDLWWVARQVAHLGNPWFTSHMAAPFGIQLGFDTTMPLAGILMTPVTLAFGPSATFSLLTIVAPGLLCYVMYRAARLWLAPAGAIAAGALFGLSSMLTWQNWYHLNISLGTIFLPLTLEAAIRLRRAPTGRRAITLGLVLGACVLVNQESAVLAAILAVLILAPWLIVTVARERPAARARIGQLAMAALTAVIVASPQLIAMIGQVQAGGATAKQGALVQTYGMYGATLPDVFAPSPRVASFGLGSLGAVFHYRQAAEGLPTFGLMLTVLALLGLAVSWRRRSAWWLTAIWLGSAALALGPTLIIVGRQYIPLGASWQGTRVSLLMPYTWLVRIPGLSALREADRLALLGLIGAAVLAGMAVDWLSRRARPLMVAALVLAALEAGWSGADGPGVMPTALPALDGPIARDPSSSVVLDVPWGLRGGIPLHGLPIATPPLLIATADGHPRAISYTSWVPAPTIRATEQNAFYARLNAAQHGKPSSPAQLSAARRDLRGLRIGWVLVWRSAWTTSDPAARYAEVAGYLRQTGFRPDYAADGVMVFRPGPG
jgi:hypothetical protein